MSCKCGRTYCSHMKHMFNLIEVNYGLLVSCICAEWRQGYVSLFWLLLFPSACMAELKGPQCSLEEFRRALSGFFIHQSIHSKPWHAGKHIHLQMVQTFKCFRGCSIYEVIFLERQNTPDIFQSPDSAFRRHYNSNNRSVK